MKILFWNARKKNVTDAISALIRARELDVAIIAEPMEYTNEALDSVCRRISPEFSVCRTETRRFQVFFRSSGVRLNEIYSEGRLSLKSLEYGGRRIMLGIVHLADQRNWDDTARRIEATKLHLRVQEWESEFQRRTVLIGDFNMGPFDPLMTVASGFNAMMTRQCVERTTRKLAGVDYPFFYNPMWGLFGDRTHGPAGTFFHTCGSSDNYGWNMLDQVLIRPEALPCYDNVEIIDSAGDALVSHKGRPRAVAYSDHLPIMLSLK